VALVGDRAIAREVEDDADEIRVLTDPDARQALPAPRHARKPERAFRTEEVEDDAAVGKTHGLDLAGSPVEAEHDLRRARGLPDVDPEQTARLRSPRAESGRERRSDAERDPSRRAHRLSTADDERVHGAHDRREDRPERTREDQQDEDEHAETAEESRDRVETRRQQALDDAEAVERGDRQEIEDRQHRVDADREQEEE